MKVRKSNKRKKENLQNVDWEEKKIPKYYRLEIDAINIIKNKNDAKTEHTNLQTDSFSFRSINRKKASL